VRTALKITTSPRVRLAWITKKLKFEEKKKGKEKMLVKGRGASHQEKGRGDREDNRGKGAAFIQIEGNKESEEEVRGT